MPMQGNAPLRRPETWLFLFCSIPAVHSITKPSICSQSKHKINDKEIQLELPKLSDKFNNWNNICMIIKLK